MNTFWQAPDKGNSMAGLRVKVLRVPPSGAVEQQRGMSALGDVARDFIEMKLHGGGVGEVSSNARERKWWAWRSSAGRGGATEAEPPAPDNARGDQRPDANGAQSSLAARYRRWKMIKDKATGASYSSVPRLSGLFDLAIASPSPLAGLCRLPRTAPQKCEGDISPCS